MTGCAHIPWAQFVGLPHEAHGRSRAGVDCWGLGVLLYREAGVRLPSYAQDCPALDAQQDLAALIAGEAAQPPWRVVTDARPLDALLFRTGRYATHIGWAVDARRMLHVRDSQRAVIEPFRGVRWDRRLIGIFRHEALA